MYIKPKSYKLNFLGKLIVQHGIKTWFGEYGAIPKRCKIGSSTYKNLLK